MQNRKADHALARLWTSIAILAIGSPELHPSVVRLLTTGLEMLEGGGWFVGNSFERVLLGQRAGLEFTAVDQLEHNSGVSFERSLSFALR